MTDQTPQTTDTQPHAQKPKKTEESDQDGKPLEQIHRCCLLGFSFIYSSTFWGGVRSTQFDVGPVQSQEHGVGHIVPLASVKRLEELLVLGGNAQRRDQIDGRLFVFGVIARGNSKVASY